jgi:hypothetical protein
LDFTPFIKNPEQKPYNTGMASWIIHLRIAENLLGWNPNLSAEKFALGSEVLPLIPESLTWSVNHIQQYYQRTDAEIQALYNRPYIYLTAAQADCFVVASTRQISRIYKQLWIDGMPADGLVSALDLKF